MKPYFHVVSKMFFNTDTHGIVGVRDHYRSGKFMYSRVSTEKKPVWHAPHPQFMNTPIISLLTSFPVFVEVGDI